jgi:hypothetical protein
MNKILVTAFEPFGTHGTLTKRNASQDVLAALKGSDLIKCVLPVSGDAETALMHLLHQHRPAGVL